MTYGLDSGLFIENGPEMQTLRAASMLSFNRLRGWQKLDPENRLALIETALRAPSNDLIDDYPVAL